MISKEDGLSVWSIINKWKKNDGKYNEKEEEEEKLWTEHCEVNYNGNP